MKLEMLEAGGATGAKSGDLVITVIKPGTNLSKTRHYPPEVLKRDYKIFEGAKMHLDHATQAEDKARPEGSIQNWVASLKEVHAEEDGTITGRAVIIDPRFQEKVNMLAQKGLLNDLGVSIRAFGEASKKEIDGCKVDYVESLAGARSVDFVTKPGAFGRAEWLESDRAQSPKQKAYEAYRALGLSEQESLVASGLEQSLLSNKPTTRAEQDVLLLKWMDGCSGF